MGLQPTLPLHPRQGEGLVFMLICVFGLVSMVNAADSNTNLAFQFEAGDPQNCPQSDANILEVLPTYGWDNLRNLPMGPVVAMNYSKCKITPDRKYLVPDDMFVVPLKRSNVEIFSHLFEHFSNYTSATSETINTEAHASFGLFGSHGSVSASFSKSYEETKQHQVDDKAVTSRAQLRYVFYTVKSQPDPQLHPVLRERFLDIASSIQANDTERIEYLADLLVRDYGTHYVSSVDAGAVILQEDQINSSFVYDYQGHKSMIKAAASADFGFNIGISFGGSASYVKTASDALVNEYITNRTHSKIFSYGGPPFRANFTLDEWVDGLSNDLVAVDRAGDPLYYVITHATLPELPILTLKDLTTAVQKGVERYYEYNVYRGCTDVDKPNFSFIANFDDGSCKDPNTNFTFGGVYQSCTGGLCSSEKLSQLNPKTQDYSCPSGYENVLLYEGTKVQCVRKCHYFLWIKYDCYDDCTATRTAPNAAHYEAYWCAALHPVEQDSGYLFGGAYTSTTTNPLTRASSCPIHFTALQLGKNIYVCVSDDYELGFRYSVPFAGFFSCKSGNPLSIPGAPNNSQIKSSETTSLATFVMLSGPESWPKKCPDGYSQHLVTINEGCEINYCVKANVLSDHGLPIIRRPPFQTHPEKLENATRILVTSSGNLYMKTENLKQWTKTDMIELELALNPAAAKEPNKTGMAVGITIGTTALIGLVVTLAIVGYKRHKKLRDTPDPLITSADQADGSYNTFNETSNSHV